MPIFSHVIQLDMLIREILLRWLNGLYVHSDGKCGPSEFKQKWNNRAVQIFARPLNYEFGSTKCLKLLLFMTTDRNQAMLLKNDTWAGLKNSSKFENFYDENVNIQREHCDHRIIPNTCNGIFWFRFVVINKWNCKHFVEQNLSFSGRANLRIWTTLMEQVYICRHYSKVIFSYS